METRFCIKGYIKLKTIEGAVEFKLRFFCKQMESMWYRMSDKVIILVLGNSVSSSDKP